MGDSGERNGLALLQPHALVSTARASMTTIAALRADLDELFAPALAYSRAAPALRAYADLQAAFTIPVDLAAAGLSCAVSGTPGGGYSVVVTLPGIRVGLAGNVVVKGNGPSYVAALAEAHHQLHRRLDRIEADRERAAIRELEAA